MMTVRAITNYPYVELWDGNNLIAVYPYGEDKHLTTQQQAVQCAQNMIETLAKMRLEDPFSEDAIN